MRPLELTIEGFKSYREQATFTFEGRTLIGIVGPTGAGKSSILEAIIFALYGKTPKVERDTKKLIYSGSDDARIQLAFDVDDAVWEVTRVLRRKAAAQVVLRRFGEDAPDSSGERNVNARIEELLGLDFGAFCSSVVLPQGEFDRFLHATPAERSKILKGVFRLERVDALRESAKARSSELGGRLSALRSELQLLEAAPLQVGQIQGELSDAKRSAVSIRERLETAGRAELEIKQAEDAIRKIHESVTATTRAVERIPSESDLSSLSVDEQKLGSTLETSSASLESVGQDADVAEKRLAQVLEETGGEEVIASAKSLLRAKDVLKVRISEYEKRLAETAKASDDSRASITKLESARLAAEREVEESKRKLEELERHHAAHALRQSIRKGEPCPVCERIVEAVPTAGKVPALKSAEVSLAKAESTAKSAGTALERGREEQARLIERRASASRELDRSKKEIKEADVDLCKLLGKVADPKKEIAKRDGSVAEARKNVERTRSKIKQAQTSVSRARAAAEKIALQRSKLAATLIEVCGWLRINPPAIDASSSELLDAAKTASIQGTDFINSQYAEAKKIETAVTESSGLVETFRKEFGLEAGAPVVEALEQANAQIGRLERQIKSAEEAIARTKVIGTEAERLEGSKVLYDRLVADLTDARFTAYLLDWQRKLLARLGSEKLFELTSRYRFDEDGDFQIVDTALDEIRPAYTLSGGETFLASLALALALAEAVTLEGGPPGCFFLDEGFGTLDAETLDFALEGIESLAAPGRLIGLISHHGAVQARLDDLIVLDKVGDGTTSVVQSEGPLAYAAVGI